jgi:hypothetical protein
VDATIRQITKHADNLKLMEDLGRGESVHTAAFALKPPPTVDKIRDAIQKLKDPERRIVDELFWFWPERFGESASDPAIRALAAGDAETALKIWTAKETNPTDGHVAMHNIAVLWHLVALEWEKYEKGKELDHTQREEIIRYWSDAFKRWEHLVEDDLLWETVSARVKQIDDARLTCGFVRRMRGTLPEALDKINAELAFHYAEHGRTDLARLHIHFMRETNQGLDNVEKTAEIVLAPASTRLKEQIQRARQRADKNPADAANAARELLEQARRSLALFDLFFGKDSEVRNELSDEVAALCNQLPVAFHEATGDDKTCLEILKAALPFATSIELRQQIEKNIGTLSGNLAFKKLEPVYTLLRAIQDSKEHPRSLLDRFRREAVPALATLSVGAPGGAEAHTELFDAAAIVLRGISLAAWNTHQDRATAVAANDLAIKHACGPELKQRLLEDKASLSQIAAQPVAQERSSNNGGVGCLVVLGIIVVLAAIGSFDSTKQSSPSSTYTTPTGPSDRNSYRVPTYTSSELNRDRQAIQTAKAQAESLATQLERMAQEIERERRFLDQTSQFAVDEFNRKVNRYNSMLEQARAQDRLVNQMVDEYNAKLRRYGR